MVHERKTPLISPCLVRMVPAGVRATKQVDGHIRTVNMSLACRFLFGRVRGQLIGRLHIIAVFGARARVQLNQSVRTIQMSMDGEYTWKYSPGDSVSRCDNVSGWKEKYWKKLSS